VIPVHDGRNINAALGTLSGEGSHQQVDEQHASDNALQPQVWGSKPRIPGDPTYYDRPVIKKSPWSWDIPAYYYVGGASGGAMVLGGAATLLNRNGLNGLILKSRWIGTIGASVSAVLLIHDLGRPSRFLHMLRVFRPTSPMSMGTWILMAFSSSTGLSAIVQFAPDRFRVAGDIAAVLGGIFGLGLSGYTGVLVANSVVPVWHQPHRLMPVLFMASGAASAAAWIDLLGGNAQEHRAAGIFSLTGKVVELTAAALLEREVAQVPEVVRPLREGVSGALWQAGKMFSAVSLVFALVPKPSPVLRRVTAILATAGALCIRFGIHYAGQRSAMNPRATFHQQRQGEGAYQTTGHAAVVGPKDQRAYLPSDVAMAEANASRSNSSSVNRV